MQEPSFAQDQTLLICHAFTGRRLSHSHDSEAAGPQRPQDHHDLHAWVEQGRSGSPESSRYAVKRSTMPPGLCRRNSVTNAYERLQHLSKDKQFSDQTIGCLIVQAGRWFMQKESA